MTSARNRLTLPSERMLILKNKNVYNNLHTFFFFFDNFKNGSRDTSEVPHDCKFSQEITHTCLLQRKKKNS